MAKAPWEKYGVPSKKTGWVLKASVRATKPKAHPREKLIAAIKFQQANIDKDIGKKAWFKPHADGDVMKGQVRYGTAPLKLSGDNTYLELPAELLGQFYADILAATEAGKFDAQLETISEKMSARRSKG